MAEQPQQQLPPEEQKPGYGVDRTQIRELLALTPSERMKYMAEAARNLEVLMEKLRRIR